MTKHEIFDDIVSIMEKDSATYKDYGIGNAAFYRTQISEEMADEDFTVLMKRYLASFEGASHLSFRDNASKVLPFSVRRIGEALYVTNADGNSGFTRGDKLIALGEKSIPEAAAEYKELLGGETEERQRWGGIACLFSEATVEEKDKTHRTKPIRLVDERETKTPYAFSRINSNTVLLRFDDFAEDEPILKLIQAHEEEIRSAENLVIDVRENAGGSDTAFFPLLPFCFAVGEQPDLSDGAQEINFTVRNVDMRKKMLEPFLQDTSYHDIVSGMLAELDENRGKGFVADAAEASLEIEGLETPKHVYVLTDSNCGSSGDAFVELVRLSSKVTVVGRPTMGILDYSNQSEVAYDHYVFCYPTSRRLAIDRGIRMGKKGVPVDIYLPFTEEHLCRDVELEEVLKRIDQARSE